MKIQKITFYLLLTLSLGWVSCIEEDQLPELPTHYEGGVFILNEGNYGQGNASLGFYNSNTSVFRDFAYSDANGVETLGDILQSGNIIDDQLYLILNGTGKIISADLKDSLKTTYEIEGLEQPRFMVHSGSKGYVSNWVSYDKNGYIAVVDLEAGSILKNIPMGNQPEAVLIANGKLFVSNQGVNNLLVVSLSTEQVKDTIAVGTSPNGLVLDAEGDLWVMCAGAYQENNGVLYEIDTESLAKKKEIQLAKNTSGKIAISPAKDQIYYYSGTNVYAIATSATTPPSAALIEESSALGFYGLGVFPTGELYLSDARDYVQSGEVFRYKADGTLISKFKAGLLPNGFVFN